MSKKICIIGVRIMSVGEVVGMIVHEVPRRLKYGSSVIIEEEKIVEGWGYDQVIGKAVTITKEHGTVPFGDDLEIPQVTLVL